MSARVLQLEDGEGAAQSIAEDLLREGYDGRPSLYVGIFAHGLALRIVRALDDPACIEPLVAWIERTSGSLPMEPRLATMLAAARAIVFPAIRTHPRAFDVLSIVEASLGAALRRYTSGRINRDLILEDDLDGTIAAFLLRLNDADPLTAEHCRAVSLWCRRLATRIGLEEDACRFAARCGLMHDVGKARTPADVLNAPRSLTDAEWIIMRDHTIQGTRMIADITALHVFEPAVRSHHERLDGKGYPDKLRANEIPLAVRIVTVADSFNAMIGRRPYRLPMSPSLALEQLVAHRGVQFDPAIVEAMVDIVENPGTSIEVMPAS